MADEPVLLVGEICVDFVLANEATPAKMRLGGLVHAARGLWAIGVPYAVAVSCPEYLAFEAKEYLFAHGCIEFILIANITGAPNVYLIGDVQEVGHQGYENLLRDAKRVVPLNLDPRISKYKRVAVFPGAFDYLSLAGVFDEAAVITVDIAYDVDSVDTLKKLYHGITNVAISTSSILFSSVASDSVDPLLRACKEIGASTLLLKENRGGSRLFDLLEGGIWEIPATLSKTMNSVGVGDVYTAVFSSLGSTGVFNAALRGMQVATRYAQTTFPDDFKRDVQRDLRLSTEEVALLGGAILPWHDRRDLQIYLAAPDFSYVDKREVDSAVAALTYHNFVVRRPVQENGEAKQGMSSLELASFYEKDVALLKECRLVLAVPLLRDPGTLVEVGLAIAAGIPVVTYDPRNENNNTMVICGSSHYGNDLDQCLNAIFELLSAERRATE